MALFGDIVDFFTGTSTTTQAQDTTTTAKQDVEKTQIGGEKQATATQTGTVGATEQIAERSLLDQGTQDVLANLIQQLGANVGGQVGQEELANLLTQRATTAPEDIQGLIDPIIAEARVSGERRLGQQGQALGREAGSTLNSLVQQLQAEGGAELDTKLASLAAQLGLQGRELATGEAATALQAGGALGESGTGQIANLAEVLKGATETSTLTGTTEEQQTQNTLTELTRVLEELSKGTTVQTTAGDTTQRKTGTILDFLKVI